MRFQNIIKVLLISAMVFLFVSCSSMKKAGAPLKHDEAIKQVKKEENINYKLPEKFEAAKKNKELDLSIYENDNSYDDGWLKSFHDEKLNK